MQNSLVRSYIIEFVGTFLLVFFAAGMVCVNQMTMTSQQSTPAHLTPPPMHGHQPGLVGVALAQGLAFAILLAVTVPLSGGYLNPAIAVMMWVFNKLESKKLAWLIGAQILGGFVAVWVLRGMFDQKILTDSFFGSPHLSRIVYPQPRDFGMIATGVGIELLLTFFLVFAIFGITRENTNGAIWGGAGLAGCVLLGFALTGAGLNPARWLGPVIWEAIDGNASGLNPWDDMFVFVAGPILGALLAGWCVFFVLNTKKADEK